jgi:hypothetical protein
MVRLAETIRLVGDGYMPRLLAVLCFVPGKSVAVDPGPKSR